jgi:hypothetical protein
VLKFGIGLLINLQIAVVWLRARIMCCTAAHVGVEVRGGVWIACDKVVCVSSCSGRYANHQLLSAGARACSCGNWDALVLLLMLEDVE